MRTKTTTAAALIGALAVLPNVAPANTAGATTLAARTDLPPHRWSLRPSELPVTQDGLFELLREHRRAEKLRSAA